MNIIYDTHTQQFIGICRAIDYARTLMNYLGHDLTLQHAMQRFTLLAVY